MIILYLLEKCEGNFNTTKALYTLEKYRLMGEEDFCSVSLLPYFSVSPPRSSELSCCCCLFHPLSNNSGNYGSINDKRSAWKWNFLAIFAIILVYVTNNGQTFLLVSIYECLLSVYLCPTQDFCFWPKHPPQHHVIKMSLYTLPFHIFQAHMHPYETSLTWLGKPTLPQGRRIRVTHGENE